MQSIIDQIAFEIIATLPFSASIDVVLSDYLLEITSEDQATLLKICAEYKCGFTLKRSREYLGRNMVLEVERNNFMNWIRDGGFANNK